MKKIINKIKNYKPSKYVCYLYFFIPIFVCSIMLNSNIYKENDIWFLLNHGKYVLNHGFPTIEPFTIHQNFSFVMQQWLSAVIFYISHSILGINGLKIILLIVCCLTLYFLYKLCMLLSENRFRLSIIVSCITQILLLVFYVPRPWIFTFLNLIIVLYIMELFYKQNNKKALYFLPLISLLQINLQASMWFMLYLFILPYFVCLVINKIKNKTDQKLYNLILIIVLMVLCGFLNPYGLDGMLYGFNSYGNKYIPNIVGEMVPPMLNSNMIYFINWYSYFIFGLIFIINNIYIYFRKEKPELRHMFLFYGVSILSLLNIRNLSLLIIGSIPFLAAYLKKYFSKLTLEERNFEFDPKTKKYYYKIVVVVVLIIFIYNFSFSSPFTSKLEKGIDAILENNKANEVVLYTNYDNGAYAEYRGLKPYLDPRAEIFIKSINHKEDILKEYYLLIYGQISYQQFVNKYNFTHMLIMKTERIYDEACKDKNYKIIYKNKKYAVFEKVKN